MRKKEQISLEQFVAIVNEGGWVMSGGEFVKVNNLHKMGVFGASLDSQGLRVASLKDVLEFSNRGGITAQAVSIDGFQPHVLVLRGRRLGRLLKKKVHRGVLSGAYDKVRFTGPILRLQHPARMRLLRALRCPPGDSTATLNLLHALLSPNPRPSIAAHGYAGRLESPIILEAESDLHFRIHDHDLGVEVRPDPVRFTVLNGDIMEGPMSRDYLRRPDPAKNLSAEFFRGPVRMDGGINAGHRVEGQSAVSSTPFSCSYQRLLDSLKSKAPMFSESVEQMMMEDACALPDTEEQRRLKVQADKRLVQEFLDRSRRRVGDARLIGIHRVSEEGDDVIRISYENGERLEIRISLDHQGHRFVLAVGNGTEKILIE